MQINFSEISDVPLKLKLNRKRLYPTNSVSFLTIKLDKNLIWKQQICDVAIKLSWTNVSLSKLRHFIDRKTLKLMSHAIFEPDLHYSSLIWAQNSNSIKIFFVYVPVYLLFYISSKSLCS